MSSNLPGRLGKAFSLSHHRFGSMSHYGNEWTFQCCCCLNLHQCLWEASEATLMPVSAGRDSPDILRCEWCWYPQEILQIHPWNVNANVGHQSSPARPKTMAFTRLWEPAAPRHGLKLGGSCPKSTWTRNGDSTVVSTQINLAWDKSVRSSIIRCGGLISCFPAV